MPPYFAARLSFPERVTPWNVDKLREAVIAGPGRNPGAVAVEDERGRVILLKKDRKVGGAWVWAGKRACRSGCCRTASRCESPQQLWAALHGSVCERPPPAAQTQGVPSLCQAVLPVRCSQVLKSFLPGFLCRAVRQWQSSF